MAHLIDFDSGPLRDVRSRLRQSHSELVDQARHLAASFLRLPGDQWGTAAKRAGVASGMQPLGELTNQAASVERLLDTLDWVAAQRSPEALVSVNPTTSSIGSDLVVEGQPRWLFEVSDVTGGKNTNRKLDKDLATLSAAATADPGARTFIVVSTEWCDWLRSASDAVWTRRGMHAPSPGDFHCGVGVRATGIIEVRPAS